MMSEAAPRFDFAPTAYCQENLSELRHTLGWLDLALSQSEPTFEVVFGPHDLIEPTHGRQDPAMANHKVGDASVTDFAAAVQARAHNQQLITTATGSLKSLVFDLCLRAATSETTNEDQGHSTTPLTLDSFDQQTKDWIWPRRAIVTGVTETRGSQRLSVVRAQASTALAYDEATMHAVSLEEIDASRPGLPGKTLVRLKLVEVNYEIISAAGEDIPHDPDSDTLARLNRAIRDFYVY